MPDPLTCRPLDPASDGVVELSRLFERYRVHYGQSTSPDATRRWVGEMAASGELRFYVARCDGQPVGFATVHQVPASLRLSRSWLLRDLYVDPVARRRGVAHRLVDTVRRAASDAGVLRLSLQTEPDNTPALALYSRCGFTPVADLVTLSLDVGP